MTIRQKLIDGRWWDREREILKGDQASGHGESRLDPAKG